jgi:ribosomal protein S18 acetylase RimI-like enzyme
MIERIGIDAAPALQRLLERSTEFWTLCEGGPPEPGSAAKELAFCFPGRTAEDSFSFAVQEGQAMIAYASVGRDFPKPSEWFLALLVLDPDHRRRGLGPKVHREILDLLAAQGATKLWIAVVTKNEGAVRFWTRLGYVERERQMRVGEAGLESEVILMSLPLPAETC